MFYNRERGAVPTGGVICMESRRRPFTMPFFSDIDLIHVAPVSYDLELTPCCVESACQLFKKLEVVLLQHW